VRQRGTSIIPIFDVSHIQNYEEELDVQDTNIWTLQVQQVEEEWTIEEPELWDKMRSPVNISPTICLCQGFPF
jgi:hypothetical protein